jgi:hypothetical protein
MLMCGQCARTLGLLEDEMAVTQKETFFRKTDPGFFAVPG